MEAIREKLKKNFVVESAPVSDDFGKLVQKTAKLIGCPFIGTLRMVEKWEPGFLAALYDDCMAKWKDRGFTSPSHMWWTERRKRLVSKPKEV